MKLASVLPPALIASLLALTAFARSNALPSSTAPSSSETSCSTGVCCLMPMAATGNAPAPAMPDTCVVSDEKLGSMGKPIEYVHKEAGRPDRVVYFCCASCIKDFKKEPAKYLAKLDASVAAKK